jgi:hypothetical protein
MVQILFKSQGQEGDGKVTGCDIERMKMASFGIKIVFLRLCSTEPQGSITRLQGFILHSEILLFGVNFPLLPIFIMFM